MHRYNIFIDFRDMKFDEEISSIEMTTTYQLVTFIYESEVTNDVYGF